MNIKINKLARLLLPNPRMTHNRFNLWLNLTKTFIDIINTWRGSS